MEVTMPPVIVGVAAGVAAAGVVSTAAAIAIGVAATALTYAVTPEFGAGSFSNEAYAQQQMLRSPAEPRRGVYGRAMVSGPLIFAEETGEDNEYLHLVVALAGHRCDAVETVYFGDEVAWTVSGGINSKFASHARIKPHLGDQTAADSQLLSDCSAWTSKHVGHGVTYLYVRLKYDVDVFPNGVPNIKALVRGKPVYDPRLDSSNGGSGTHRFNDPNTWQWTDNWALCVLDYTRFESGVGATENEIDLPTYALAAHDSDEFVEYQTDEWERRYSCNGTYTQDASPASILEKMLTAGAGMQVYVGGKYQLHAGVYQGPEVLTLTEDDCAGDVDISPYTSRSELCNAVRGTFVDPDSFYQPTDFTPYESAYYRGQDNGEYIDHDIDLPFTQSSWTAQRLAKLHLELNRAGMQITFPTKMIGLAVSVGKVVRLQLPSLGINQTFMVADWQFDFGRPVKLILRETNADIFEFDKGSYTQRDLAPNTTLPDPSKVPTVSGVVWVPSGDDANWQGELSWNAPGGNSAYRYRLEVVNQQQEVVYQASIEGTRHHVPKLDAGTYNLYLWAVNLFSNRSNIPASMTIGADAPPPVSGILADIGALSLTLRPETAAVIAATTEFEVKGSLNTVLNNADYLGQGKEVLWPNRHPNTLYYVWARSVNNYGFGAWFGPVGIQTSTDNSAIVQLIGTAFDKFTWFAWADDNAGTGFTTVEAQGEGKDYLGVATEKKTSAPSGNWQDYTWTKIKTEIPELFTQEEQTQLDNLMAGKLPSGSDDLLALQQALNTSGLANWSVDATTLLDNGVWGSLPESGATFGAPTGTFVGGMAAEWLAAGGSNSFRQGFDNGDTTLWAAFANNTFSVIDGFNGKGILVTSASSDPSPTGTTTAVYVLVPETTALQFSGRRVKVSIMARQPGANATQEFALAYSTSDVGNSGWKTFTPTNAWAKYSFTYDVPTAVAGGDDYFGIWADTSAAGLGLEVDQVLIELVSEWQTLDAPENIATLTGVESILNSGLSLTLADGQAKLLDGLAQLGNAFGAADIGGETPTGAQNKADAAKAAAQSYALTQAELAETQAAAYADGVVTAEEQRAIVDAQAKADIAQLTAINAASIDAQAKADAANQSAKEYALSMRSGTNILPAEYGLIDFDNPPILTKPHADSTLEWSENPIGTGIHSSKGVGALKLICPPTYSEVFCYLSGGSSDLNINLIPNRKWIFSAWIYAVNSDRVQLYIRTPLIPKYYAVTKTVTAGEWTQIYGTLDLTADDATKTYVRLDVDNLNGPGNEVYFANVMLEPYFDGAPLTPSEYQYPIGGLVTKTAAIDLATKAQAAAELYAQTAAELAETQANAYADGVVTAEEQRAINDAQAKADAAKLDAIAHADNKSTYNMLRNTEFNVLLPEGKPFFWDKPGLGGPISGSDYEYSVQLWGGNTQPTWHPVNKTALVVQQNNDGGGYVDQDSGRYLQYIIDLPVEPGKRYSFSVLSGAHRCKVKTYYQIRSSDNSSLSSIDPVTTGSSDNDSIKVGGETIEQWHQHGFIVTAPPGAAYMKFYIRKFATKPGGADSYMLLLNPMFTEVGLTANLLPAYIADNSGGTHNTGILADKDSLNALDVGADPTGSADNAKAGAIDDVAAGNFNAQTALITKLMANTGLFNELVARFAVFGGLTAETIAANAIDTEKLTANAVVAGKIAAGAVTTEKLTANAVTADKLTADVAMINKLVANTGLFDTLQARLALFGGLAADSIAANSISVKHLLVANTDNICTNSQFDGGNTDGWPGHVYSVSNGVPEAWGGTAWRGAINNVRNTTFGPIFQVKPGDKFHMSMHSQGFGAVNAAFRLGLRISNADGTVSFLTELANNKNTISPTYFDCEIEVTSNTAMTANIFLLMDGSNDAMGGGYTFTKLYCRKMADSKMIVDGSITTQKIISKAISTDKIAANAVTASELLADSALINKLVATTALFDSMQARFAVFGGLSANSISSDAILGRHIKAGEIIESPVIVGGQYQLIGSNTMKIESETPFGPDGLVEWRGPKLILNGQPNWANIRKSNATRWTDSNGNEYFGGSLSAGVLKTGVTNPDKNAYAANSYPVVIGPFGTGGKAKTVVVSFDYDASWNSTTNVSTTAPKLSWQLQRQIGAGAWATVSSGTFTGSISSTYEAEISKYNVNEFCNGSSTFTDTSTSTSDFSYRVKVISQTRYSVTSNVNNQKLTVISTEQ
jgi:hypothetical protein